MIYISGGITGVDNYLEKFEKAEEYLSNMGYTVVNPAKVMDYLPKDTPYNMYMDVSLAMLKNCNSIYMLKGWGDSKGAKLERRYATTYGLDVLYES